MTRGTMHALTVHGSRVEVEERPIPKANPREVVVRTTAASLCSADVAGVLENVGERDGIVLGHEAVGVIHQIGYDVYGFAVGQRVTVSSGTSCGQCTKGQRGYSGHCGGEPWAAYSSGVNRDGSMAEYFCVPDATRNLTLVPEGVSDAAAVCVTDALASGTVAPEAAHLPLGAAVAVFGQGHIGLAATAGARALGAGLIVTVKARPGGESLSRAMGADHCLNLSDHNPAALLRQLTNGIGVDCAIDATGVPQSFSAAIEATRLGGTIAVLSSYAGPHDAVLHIPLAHWGWGIGDKTILSTFAPTGNERLSRLLRTVQTGRIDPTPMLTHHYAFDDVLHAFTDLRDRLSGLVKPLITF